MNLEITIFIFLIAHTTKMNSVVSKFRLQHCLNSVLSVLIVLTIHSNIKTDSALLKLTNDNLSCRPCVKPDSQLRRVSCRTKACLLWLKLVTDMV